MLMSTKWILQRIWLWISSTEGRCALLGGMVSSPHGFEKCAHEHKMRHAKNPHPDCIRQRDKSPFEQRCPRLPTDSEFVLMSTKLFLWGSSAGFCLAKGRLPLRAESPLLNGFKNVLMSTKCFFGGARGLFSMQSEESKGSVVTVRIILLFTERGAAEKSLRFLLLPLPIHFVVPSLHVALDPSYIISFRTAWKRRRAR